MNILYIFQDEYPWDVRVEKVVWSLAKSHAVHILCRNRGALEPGETIDGVRVVRVGGKGLRAITGFPAFFSPWWIAAGLSLVRAKGVDLIVVRDLPLAPLALLLRRLTGVPVIFDMAEDYPAMIRATWRSSGVRLSDYLIRNPVMLKQLETFVLRRANEIWVVSEASRARTNQDANGLVRVVRNTPKIDILDLPLVRSPPVPPLQIIYTGLLSVNRGLATVITAVRLARDAGSEMILKIVGNGTNVNELTDLAKKLGIAGSVQFLGWKSQAELRELIMRCHVGVVPHHVNEHTATTLPNKIYDYMALGRPVVVSNAPALEELVLAAKCGLVFQDRNPKSLLACLLQLASPEVRSELGENGRRAVSECMNWSVDEAVIMRAVGEYLSDCS